MHPSAKSYTRLSLQFYDAWVLWLSNTFAWHCPTTSVLSPFFTHHIQNSLSHLDIGVGTGYYLCRATRHILQHGENTKISLLDLNPNTLDFSSTRVRKNGFRGVVDTLEHDIFQPLPQHLHGQFDTISAFYLFHCLPGSFPAKITAVLQNLVPALAPDGTFYGATILGKNIEHNMFGKALLRFYNWKGIFSNRGDGVDRLKGGLGEYFEDVEVRVVGTVALFTAKRPISSRW